MRIGDVGNLRHPESIAIFIRTMNMIRNYSKTAFTQPMNKFYIE